MRLQAEIEIARLDSWLDRGGRRIAVPGSDPTGEPKPKARPPVERESALIDALPAWLTALPYRSQLADVTMARLAALDVHAQARLEQRLSEVAKLVRKVIASPKYWLDLSDDAATDDHLVAFALDDLP